MFILFRADKCVIVNDNDSLYYDYLFLFNGEQFVYSIGKDDTKSKKSEKHAYERKILFIFINTYKSLHPIAYKVIIT